MKTNKCELTLEDLKKINFLKDDEYEIALAKMLYLKISKYYYRDEEFFLFKENLSNRKKIYQRENANDEFNITCNSICKLMKNELEKYGIKVELVSLYNDEFQHVELLLTTKLGNKYIIDPLMDLIEIKTYKKTKLFASEKSAKEYAKIDDTITFVDNETMNKIDEAIEYPINEVNYEDYQTTSEAVKYLLEQRGNINGIVDMKIYFNIELKKMNILKCHAEDFYIEKSDINNPLFFQLEFKNDKVRGLLIEEKDKVIVFPFENNSLKIFDKKDWQKLLTKNNIKINRIASVKCLKELKEMQVDRNILHNRKFLKEMHNYENFCEKDNKNILDFITYKDGHLFVNYQCNVEFYIDNNNLIKINHDIKNREVYTFTDENTYNTEIVNFGYSFDKKKDFLNRTDICGLFHLNPNNEEIIPYLTKCENNYLSRNYNEYYIFTSFNDLLKRRDKLINLLIKNTNLTIDEKYVVLENILNISSKIFYLTCLHHLINNDEKNYEHNHKVFVSDIKNFLLFINNNENCYNFASYNDLSLTFNVQQLLLSKKQVELDNKCYILDYVEKLTDVLQKSKLGDIVIMTPGYGSIYLGPFITALKNIESTIILFSQYKRIGIEEIDNIKEIEKLIINPDILIDKNIVLIDDNMGTGTTLKIIRKHLEEVNYNIALVGAYQYTFDRLQEYSIKVKGKELFNPKDIDLLTPVNYPRHHIIEEAVENLRVSADKYINYLRMFGYHSENISDYDRNLLDSIFYYKRFTDSKIYDDDTLKNNSKILIKNYISEEKLKIIKEYL